MNCLLGNLITERGSILMSVCSLSIQITNETKRTNEVRMVDDDNKKKEFNRDGITKEK